MTCRCRLSTSSYLSTSLRISKFCCSTCVWAERMDRVTISTNMAGRGTDILLGGNPEMMAKHEVGPEPDAPMEGEAEEAFQARRAEWAATLARRTEELKIQTAREHDEVVAVGGLHIVGTERHESRRIDNQLRGRAGRQGDPGSSIFYLSLEDELMRIFGSDRISGLMERMGMKPGEQIEHPWLTKSIEGAQKKVEAHNFDIRKNLLEYDDVMNQQRRSIYALRRMVLGFGAGIPVVEYDEDPKTRVKTRREKVWTLEDQREHMLDLVEDLVIDMVSGACPQNVGDWNLPGLSATVKEQFGVDMKFGEPGGKPAEARRAIEEQVFTVVQKAFQAKEAELGVDADGVPVLRRYEQWLYLQAIDQMWKDHLLSMDHLRQGIGLRGYGQKDPKQEYKKEGYEMFVAMTWRIKAAVMSRVLSLQLVRQETAEEIEAKRLAAQRRALQRLTETHAESGGDGETPRPKQETVVRQTPKVGRNDPCPCGSGKKYKKCHGVNEASA
ncbi:MAG TPA: SEC-C metal-binding domain-containing protein [Anaeromyxobacteraceae bacterium]|nr:SEC-C metal-binding domain-containing protein [Anaeromyxobacteraceae bacterium]